MRKVYIAGPFRAKNAWAVEQNIRRAEVSGMAVFELGYTAFIPHANTRYFDGTLNDKFWLQATSAWLPGCDAVLLVEGWEDSAGTLGEIDLATDLGIPVFTSISAMDNYLRRLDNESNT
jgi:nucleoside 2-deoxyribosyltransferase